MSNLMRSGATRLSRGQVAVAIAAGVALLSVASSRPAEPRSAGAPTPAAPSPSSTADSSAIERVLSRAGAALSDPERERIARAVVRFATKYGLDPELVTAVMLVESRGMPGARSPKGAMGLMQVMPAMLQPLGLAGNFTTVESNVEAGCLILADNIRRMGEADGILAYFWGPHIRGGIYLERVRAARAEVRRILQSS